MVREVATSHTRASWGGRSGGTARQETVVGVLRAGTFLVRVRMQVIAGSPGQPGAPGRRSENQDEPGAPQQLRFVGEHAPAERLRVVFGGLPLGEGAPTVCHLGVDQRGHLAARVTVPPLGHGSGPAVEGASEPCEPDTQPVAGPVPVRFESQLAVAPGGFVPLGVCSRNGENRTLG